MGKALFDAVKAPEKVNDRENVVEVVDELEAHREAE